LSWVPYKSLDTHGFPGRSFVFLMGSSRDCPSDLTSSIPAPRDSHKVAIVYPTSALPSTSQPCFPGLESYPIQ